jgi:ribosomal protein S18 acetylase RimI-like enzyme
MALQGFIRKAMDHDLDQLVELYLECFPQRAREIFGASDKRIFIRDYLGFYASWDPDGSWVYVEDDQVLGFIIAPCRYSPWKAALSKAQVWRWTVHFLRGQYGFPIHVISKFLAAGFAFNRDPQIRQMWGKPFIHGLAVAARVRRQGVATALVCRAMQEHRHKGARFCFAVLRPGSQAISVLEKAGFKVSHLTPDQEPVMILQGDAIEGEQGW